jgi:hypothetical protein
MGWLAVIVAIMTDTSYITQRGGSPLLEGLLMSAFRGGGSAV